MVKPVTKEDHIKYLTVLRTLLSVRDPQNSQLLEENGSPGLAEEDPNNFDYVEESIEYFERPDSRNSISSYLELGENSCIQPSPSDTHVKLLVTGGIFLKFGRRGKPHLRHVFVSADLKLVQWRALNRTRPSGTLSTVSINEISSGRKTRVFQRFRSDKEDLSFSIVADERTLDLELTKDNRVARDEWEEAFHSLVDQELR